MSATYFQTVQQKHCHTQTKQIQQNVITEPKWWLYRQSLYYYYSTSVKILIIKAFGFLGGSRGTYEHSSKTLTLSQPSGGSLLNI